MSGDGWDLEGAPWGTYRKEELAYARGQAGTVGSGLLGGAAFGGYGGPVVDEDRATRDAIRAELRRLREEARASDEPEMLEFVARELHGL
jgi:hypothetical protein